MQIFDIDVLIIGGGPSGASAALSLLNYKKNIKVALVEQSDLNKIRVGEHVSASIFDLLKYLNLSQSDFEEDCFIPTYGTISYWGNDYAFSRDNIWTTERSTFQIDREKFDLTLLQKIAERGGHVFPRTRCQQIQQDKNKHWDIQLSHPTQGKFFIKAKFLLDATGRQANICRQIGVSSQKLDALVGVGAFLKVQDNRTLKHDLLLESTENGWWYSAVLPGNILTATFFTDADIVSTQQLNKSDKWSHLLQDTKRMKYRLGNTISMSSQLWVRNAFSQISNSTESANFMAIGDAAASFDPISSMGIGFAMTSACHAANIVQLELEERKPERIAVYQQDIMKNFDNYLNLRKQFYQQEQRWEESEFWNRRRGI